MLHDNSRLFRASLPKPIPHPTSAIPPLQPSPGGFCRSCANCFCQRLPIAVPHQTFLRAVLHSAANTDYTWFIPTWINMERVANFTAAQSGTLVHDTMWLISDYSTSFTSKLYIIVQYHELIPFNKSTMQWTEPLPVTDFLTLNQCRNSCKRHASASALEGRARSMLTWNSQPLPEVAPMIPHSNW